MNTSPSKSPSKVLLVGAAVCMCLIVICCIQITRTLLDNTAYMTSSKEVGTLIEKKRIQNRHQNTYEIHIARNNAPLLSETILYDDWEALIVHSPIELGVLSTSRVVSGYRIKEQRRQLPMLIGIILFSVVYIATTLMEFTLIPKWSTPRWPLGLIVISYVFVFTHTCISDIRHYSLFQQSIPFRPILILLGLLLLSIGVIKTKKIDHKTPHL